MRTVWHSKKLSGFYKSGKSPAPLSSPTLLSKERRELNSVLIRVTYVIQVRTATMPDRCVLCSDFVGEIGFDDLRLTSVPISWEGRSKQRPYSALLRWILRFGLGLRGVYCPKKQIS